MSKKSWKKATPEVKESVGYWQEKQEILLSKMIVALEQEVSERPEFYPLLTDLRTIHDKWPYVRTEALKRIYRRYEAAAEQLGLPMFHHKQANTQCTAPCPLGKHEDVHWCDLQLGHDGPHVWSCQKED